MASHSGLTLKTLSSCEIRKIRAGILDSILAIKAVLVGG